MENMEHIILTSLALALSLTALPSVKGQTCAITSNTIVVAGPSNFLDPSQYGFALHGFSKGGAPTSYTWRRDGVVLTSSSPYTIAAPELTSSENPCSERFYRSRVTVTGKVTGNFTYTVTNADTGNDVVATLNIEDADTPSNLMVRQNGRLSIEINWTPTATPPSMGYQFTTVEDVSVGTPAMNPPYTYTAINIRVGSVINISLVARSAHFFSGVLGPVSVTILDILDPIVTSSSVTATTATIALAQPMDSLPADQYTVALNRSGQQPECPDYVHNVNMTTSSDSVMFEGLEENSVYSVSVIANTFDLTRSVSAADITTLTAAPSAAPRELTFKTVNSKNITLTWRNIKCIQRNGMITSFDVQYEQVDGALTTMKMESSGTSSHIVIGLLPFTEYRFQIAGVNIHGPGPYTAFIGPIRTNEDVPGPVSGLMGSAKFYSVDLSWKPPQMPNGVLTSYGIMYRENGSSSFSTASGMATLDPPTYIISNLEPQTTITNITITAHTQIGPGPSVHFSDVFITLTEPPIVMDVVVRVLNDTSVRVSWKKLVFEEITQYLIFYSQTGSRKRQTESLIMVNNTESSVEITGLITGAEYQFQVVAQAVLDGETIMGQRSSLTSMSVLDVFVTTLPTISSGGGSSPAAAIVGGLILVVALLAVLAFAAIFIYLWRIKRLKFFKPTRSTERVKLTSKSDLVLGSSYKLDSTEPAIEEFPEETYAIMGEGVFFKVLVTGKPTPSLTWYHNEQEVIANYALEIQEDGTLSIATSEVNHSGVYRLMAKNSAGSAAKEVKLLVEPEGKDSTPDLEKEYLQLKPISLEEFGEYVALNHSNGNKIFRDQFQALYDGEGLSKTVGLSAEFKKLNRFANITVYDVNRVVLEAIPSQPDCQGEFINACYIDGFIKPRKFLASQGPIPRTLVDFWRLIWQEKPPTIVMVTNLKEGNKNKCQQYWPDTGSMKFGPFKVTLTENVMLADYCIRTMQVSFDGSNRPFKLTQFHFTTWPDHGVPDYATPMLAFHRRVISTHKNRKGPILVHCSAGVGRTGTFICIDNILEQIKKEQLVDIAGTITKMRHERMKMVQTPEQFVFLHDAILESVRCGDTQFNAADLRTILHKYDRRDPATGLTKFQSLFSVLEQVSPKPSEVMSTSARKNPDRNRSDRYLPSDRFRVLLKGESNDYIHAVFAHGYKHQKAYIIAEGPMASTVENMLQVLYNRKCGVVVMLSNLQENGKETCSQYWPKVGEMMAFGRYVVDLLSEVEHNGYTIRTISILHEKKAHQVIQFHITGWKSDGGSSNLKGVVDVVEEVAKVQRKTGNKPIFVHCTDTVTRSGIFCVLASVIDRCKTEAVVDVFQVVKALRIQKPGAVPTLNNFRFIFEAMLTFLDSFDTYANFQS